MNKNYSLKLVEYYNLLDFENKYYGKDFKNNYKFIQYCIQQFIKSKKSELEILNFIQDTIDVHNKNYS